MCCITDDVLWRATRRADYRQTKERLYSRRGPVHSNGWLCPAGLPRRGRCCRPPGEYLSLTKLPAVVIEPDPGSHRLRNAPWGTWRNERRVIPRVAWKEVEEQRPDRDGVLLRFIEGSELNRCAGRECCRKRTPRLLLSWAVVEGFNNFLPVESPRRGVDDLDIQRPREHEWAMPDGGEGWTFIDALAMCRTGPGDAAGASQGGRECGGGRERGAGHNG